MPPAEHYTADETMVCFLSTIQSPIQAFLRPAVWIPGLNRLHSHREQWVSLSGTADQLVDELIQAVDRVAEADPKITYAVKQVDREKHRVQIYNWTWAEWLDVVEIEFRNGANGGVEAECFSFSSGFLPTWFPLCFIFNVIFFWIPFYDNKFNSTRLEQLRVSMATECRLVPKKKSEPDETTPIVSDKRSSTSPPHRHTSVSSTEATPTDAKPEAMARGSPQEVATPTNADPLPASASSDAEPSVMISKPHSVDVVQTGTTENDVATGAEGSPSEDLNSGRHTAEPVNT